MFLGSLQRGGAKPRDLSADKSRPHKICCEGIRVIGILISLETRASPAVEAVTLQSDNAKLKADLQYFAEPENLAKELKAKFDYKKPGEKLIKIQ